MNERIRVFTDLFAWQKAHALAVGIYRLTHGFPKEEVFGLVSQMRRSAVSVSSNIAEGFSRRTFKDKEHFYCMAQGSLTELQSQLLISRDVGYMNGDEFDKIYSEAKGAHIIITLLIKKTKEFGRNL